MQRDKFWFQQWGRRAKGLAVVLMAGAERNFAVDSTERIGKVAL